jgi:predicted nucleic acid-binding protein
MSVLIDSDIVIEVLRARNQTIVAQWSALAESNSTVFVSPVTFAEVGAGAFDHEIERIAQLLAPLACAPIDERIGQLAGKYLRRYGRSHNLKIADALIAASALQSQAALWTRNREHYPMPELVFHA